MPSVSQEVSPEAAMTSRCARNTQKQAKGKKRKEESIEWEFLVECNEEKFSLPVVFLYSYHKAGSFKPLVTFMSQLQTTGKSSYRSERRASWLLNLLYCC